MNNLQRLQAELRKRGVSAMLLSDISSVQWVTGFTGSFGYLLVAGDEAIFVSDSRYTVQAKEEMPELDVRTYASPTSLAEFLGQQVSSLGVKVLGFESDKVVFSSYEEWSRALPCELQPVNNLTGALRMIKTPQEIAKIKNACGLADACFEHVMRAVQPGVSEFDIGLEIEFFFRRHGAKIAFDPVVVSGHRSARPHGRASEKKLERGDFLTLDFGATVDGYNSDITRTVVVQEASERHVQVYNAVLEAQLAALAAMRPGITGKEADAAARDRLAQHGLAEYFGHGLGHGLGRLVHDTGRLNPSSTDVLEPGQVWTVEPGVYIEGFGGVRIEDDVVVTETGIENLTGCTKELLVLP